MYGIVLYILKRYVKFFLYFLYHLECLDHVEVNQQPILTEQRYQHLKRKHQLAKPKSTNRWVDLFGQSMLLMLTL